VPLCYVDLHGSPTFASQLASLRKRFSKIDKDLEEIWPDIANDYRHARHAESIPRFQDTVFKYRSKCSDMSRGSRGGYRIICYYHQPKNTLYPILIYHKADQDDVDEATVATVVRELLQIHLDLPEEQ
jgi:mRNA-degrading endonuclease RelE of RelBE toxin-antitoxin system